MVRIKFKSDFNLTTNQIENLIKLPAENKKSIYKSYLNRKKKEANVSNEESVEYYVEAIDNLIACLSKSSNPVGSSQSSAELAVFNDDNFQESLNAVEDLKLALRTSPLR